MKLVLLSDIHGNYVALRKVLEDLGNENHSIVCLGDVAWGGPQPFEVITRLRKLACPVVMGNTDEVLIGTRRENHKRPNALKMKEIGVWCRNILSYSDKAFIKSFKPLVRLDIGGEQILCYHGSPRSNTEEILAFTDDKKLEEIVVGHGERFLVGGHTHIQMLRRYRNKLIINPGSVGLPFEVAGKKGTSNPTWAEYAIINYESGNLCVSLKRVEYDVEELEESVYNSGMPHKEWWIRDWK